MYRVTIRKNYASENSETIPYAHPTSKVVCVGRNYVAHAKELNNPVPTEPLLFIKPTNTLVPFTDTIMIPGSKGECHHEVEIALLINQQLKNVDEHIAGESIEAVGIGLDLTLRDLQSKLKEKKQPWEKAKSFDGACPITSFILVKEMQKDNGDLSLANLSFELRNNKITAQKGNTQNVIFSFPFLISEISKHFTLYPGDIILTGTPEGVSALNNGDCLSVELNNINLAKAKVKVI